MDTHPVYRFDNFEVDSDAWRLSRGGQEIHLEPVVLKLLIYLIANRGRLVTRQELMDTVWGDTVIGDSALTKAAARLRRALGDDSSTHHYLETVHSQGYRFIAAVEEVERPSGPEPPSRQSPARAVSRNLLAGTTVLVMLIILAVLGFRAPPHAETVRSIAVLPLSNLTGNPEKEYYVNGLQDLLITELAQIPDLRVTSRQSTRRYRNSSLAATDIADELGVDALVEGSLLRADSQIEVTVQLIHGQGDEHLWAERYTSEILLGFNLISDVADAIGTEIGAVSMPPEGEGLAQGRMGPIDPRAFNGYLLGTAYLDSLTRDGISNAIDQLKTAVAIEPGFAQAWGLLASAYAMEGLFGFTPPRVSIEMARAAALNAIEADEQFHGGHSALGWARLWTGDIDGACESFEKVLRLNPSNTAAIHGEADCLMFDGHMDESLARLHDLLTISPFGVIQNLPLPAHLFVARRFEEAIAAATLMQERTPQFSMHWFLAMVYWQQGRFDKALEEERLELERRGDTDLLAAMEEGLDAGGPVGAMRTKAEVLVARAGEFHVDPFDIAETFARAGLVEETLHWLDKAIEHGSFKVTYIAFWPQLDVVRDDPQYQDFLERAYGERAQEIGQLADSIRLQDR
jgi:TolB-like protein/DNA-binding winged helix-turn-helix (wHTH) protein